MYLTATFFLTVKIERSHTHANFSRRVEEKRYRTGSTHTEEGESHTCVRNIHGSLARYCNIYVSNTQVAKTFTS